jgi:hypothetical protein
MTAPADNVRDEVRADEVRDFAQSFRGFLRWIQETDTGDSHSNEVVKLVRSHLGADGLAQSVVSRELPPFEQVNVQVALTRGRLSPGVTSPPRGLPCPRTTAG